MINNKIKALLRPYYYLYKDIFDFKGKLRLKKNRELYNKHEGSRAFLLCTGESLHHIDIEKLNHEFTYGTNLLFLHDDFPEVNLDYYVYLDTPRSFYPNMPQWPKTQLGSLGNKPIRQIYEKMDKRIQQETQLILNSECFKFTNGLFDYNKKFFAKVTKNLNLNNEIPYNTLADISKRRLCGGGIIFFSILIMIYMGFKEIYLCGSGYTYNPSFLLHFYDNFITQKSMGEKKSIQSIKEQIIQLYGKDGGVEYYGHLDKDHSYRAICVRFENSATKSYLAKHSKLNEYAKSQGVRIFNITPPAFESPVYEQISWESVVQDLL